MCIRDSSHPLELDQILDYGEMKDMFLNTIVTSLLSAHVPGCNCGFEKLLLF